MRSCALTCFMILAQYYGTDRPMDTNTVGQNGYFEDKCT